MSQEQEPNWGEAPDGDLIAELLRERYPLEPGESLAVETNEEERAISLSMTAGRDVYRMRVAYLRGAGDRDPWLLMVDALDNLFGSFLESNRRYRDLPQGSGVEFAGAFFTVVVEHARPELDRLAEQILRSGGSHD